MAAMLLAVAGTWILRSVFGPVLPQHRLLGCESDPRGIRTSLDLIDYLANRSTLDR